MEPEKLSYFDCHSHVLDIPTQYQEQVLQTAYDGNIHHITVNTTSSEQYDAMRKLEEREEGRIVAGFGIHPLFVYKQMDKSEDQWMKELSLVLGMKQRYTVGEIGLDFRKNVIETNPKPQQLQFFTQQFNLAMNLQRPVTIHCVHAHGQMLKFFKKLSKQQPNNNTPIIMHSYGGSKQITQSLIKLQNLNIYFSLSLKRSQKLCEVIPIEKLLCQTDAPCQNNLTLLQKPNPYAMKVGVETSESNEPLNVISNVHSLYQYYQLDQPTFIKQIYTNALKAFKLIK